jgi:hypothetical protein
MFPHPDTCYAVRRFHQRDLLAEAERHRLSVRTTAQVEQASRMVRLRRVAWRFAAAAGAILACVPPVKRPDALAGGPLRAG